MPLWLSVGIVAFVAFNGVAGALALAWYLRPSARLSRFLAALEVEWAYYQGRDFVTAECARLCMLWIRERSFVSPQVRLIGVQRVNEWAALARRESAP